MSQDCLAARLGVTEQQVQGYESGTDHLSANRLYQIARVLELDVQFFYDGLGGENSCPFSLSEDRYEFLRQAVRRIAADHELTSGGRRKRMPLHQAVEVARSVCDVLGWSYRNQSDAERVSISH
jgi:transcriptional regulator with XRE-family HTH domain